MKDVIYGIIFVCLLIGGKGFNSFMETNWKSLNIVEPNGLIRLKKKLQALKIAIKAWSKEANKRSNDRKINIQQNLSEVDKLIDQGKSNDEILIKRITLLNDLQEHNNRNAINGMIFKVDFEKPLDFLKWDYLDETLKAFGFGSKWHNLIGSCLNKSIGLVLVNGSSTLDFQLPKGLKQGCFYLASRLKDNLLKKKLMEIGVSSNVVAATAAASLIVCTILTAPFNYLDVKVGSNMRPPFPFKFGSHLDSALSYVYIQGEVALKVLYKRLYALEMCKSISVAEKMGHPSLSHSFRRMPRGGVEQENYGLLRSKAADLVLLNVLDRWCWSLEGSQEFSVKSSRILIDNIILPKAEVLTRWLKVVPIKVNVHAWRVCLENYLLELIFRLEDGYSINCLSSL
uniref:RNA-directed DNA polymerase, eukaryota n=1 Tax=Tanacetum cinerariifolium TaxID=118510 RepID=A0A699JN65_TANCI|nr:RNA-directed DNA polymerase, eukaryota [Tanacetum cinerariifolium]